MLLAEALVLLALLCLLARSVSSSNHALVLSACFAPYATVLDAVAVGVLAVSGRRVGAGVALIVLLALATPWLRPLRGRGTVYRRRSDADPSTPDRYTLRVMSSNLMLGQADSAAVLRTAAAHRADLLMVQELTCDALAGLRTAGIGDQFGFQYAPPAAGGVGTALFSRYPLTGTRCHPGFSLQVISASMSLGPGSEPITVLSSHLAPPWPFPAAVWRAESLRLGQLLGETEGLLVAAGDFNATTSHRPFRQLLRLGRVSDAASVTGSVTLRSYPANRRLVPPLLGLDHVLVRGLRPVSAAMTPIHGSDHRALLVTVELPGDSRCER